MIRAYSVFTTEIDDVDAAVLEICGQLPSADELLASTIGLVGCLPYFIESGVVAALQNALPFDLVGQTTIASAARGCDDSLSLTLLVLTSDELTFVLRQTEPITGEVESLLIDSYEEATGDKPDEQPAFILAYAPLLLNVGGDFFVRTLDVASGGVPLFGALSVDNTIDYHDSQVIFKGETSRDRLAYVLVYGSVQPKFYLVNISSEKIFDKTGLVTASAGNHVLEVDGKPAVEFLKANGLATDEKGVIEGVNSFPYIVDFNDGTKPVVRVIFAITEEGAAVCLGDIPVGSTLSVGYFDDDEILSSSKAKVDALNLTDARAVIIFSCIGRYLMLGFTPERGLAAVQDGLAAQDTPYVLTYCGGEICPVGRKDEGDEQDTDGAEQEPLRNRFHNSTMIALVL
ncbi:MAG: FIST C-terminal domain-containing protein [Coriobacteriales bacterium]|nr:FIST C-terminal domain-containing protein [Coriobacteriales bacterium]